MKIEMRLLVVGIGAGLDGRKARLGRALFSDNRDLPISIIRNQTTVWALMDFIAVWAGHYKLTRMGVMISHML